MGYDKIKDFFISGAKVFLKYPLFSVFVSLLAIAAAVLSQSLFFAFVAELGRKGLSAGVALSLFSISTALVAASFFVRFLLIRAALFLTEENRSFSVSSFLECSKHFWKYVATLFILVSIVFVGAMFLIVPGIIFGVGFFFFGFIIADTGAGPIQALRESWRITRGKKLQLFALLVSLAIFNVLGLLFLGFGLLFTIAVSYFVLANAYRRLSSDSVAAPGNVSGELKPLISNTASSDKTALAVLLIASLLSWNGLGLFLGPAGFERTADRIGGISIAYAGGDSTGGEGSGEHGDTPGAVGYSPAMGEATNVGYAPGFGQPSVAPAATPSSDETMDADNPAPDPTFSFSVGIVATVLSAVFGPIGALAAIGLGLMGAPDIGVNVSVNTNTGEVDATLGMTTAPGLGTQAVGAALGVASDAVSNAVGNLGVTTGQEGDFGSPPGDTTLAGDSGNDSLGGPGSAPGSSGGADGGQGPAVLSQQVVVNSQTGSLAGLSCPADSPQLCGTSASNASCIPATAVCCTSVGYADRYCPANNFCTTDGRCESSTGGRNCAAGYNSACQSPANSCGMTNSGFTSCNGSCQAVTPADSSCPTPGITLTQTPSFVNVGNACAVVWSTTNTTACNLVNMNTGATAASGKNGTYITPPMTAQIDFRLNCQNGIVVSNHADVSCRINPAFIEN